METLVIGHRNPDMDAVCAAIGYASLKRHLGMEGVRPACCGTLNDRILHVLRKFGVPEPEFIPDVSPRVRDVMVTDFHLTRWDRPIYGALSVMEERRIRALPVVDGDRRFHGLISENKLLTFLFPRRHEAGRAREVQASLANIAETLEGEALTGPLSREDILHALVVAAMDVESFALRLGQLEPARTVLFVGDREDIQRIAIRGGIRALVVTGGSPVSEEVLEEALAEKTTVIRSPHDTASSVLLSRGAVIARHVLEPSRMRFEADMPLEAARKAVVLSNQFIFPVIDSEGVLEGIFSKSDFLKPPNRQLILVDHNELTQAVPGAADVPVIEILDHHRLGSFGSEAPILFINQPVGSTSTIVADLHARHGVDPAPAVAGLLMAGIISDTLNLTSPTTTAVDRDCLERLAQITGVDPAALAEEIFSVGSPLLTMQPSQALLADCKEYEQRGRRFSVSQIEELTFAHFAERRDDLLAALADLVEDRDYCFAALLVTDINTRNSYLLASGEPKILRNIDYPEDGEGVWVLDGVVSRKKQLLPYLTQCLQKAG